MTDTRRLISRLIEQNQVKQASGIQEMRNLPRQLQRQVLVFQTGDSNSIHMQIDNENFQNVYCVMQFISSKLLYLIMPSLSGRLISMPCSFQSFAHIVYHIIWCVDEYNTLFFPSFAVSCGVPIRKCTCLLKRITHFYLGWTRLMSCSWPPINVIIKEGRI